LAEGEVKENAEEKEYDCLKISFRKYSWCKLGSAIPNKSTGNFSLQHDPLNESAATVASYSPTVLSQLKCRSDYLLTSLHLRQAIFFCFYILLC
jgi:hypothetical protein